jgi:hypothetical protein
MGKARETDLPVLDDAFRVSLRDTDVFSGAIVTGYNTTPWLFLVMKDQNKLPGRDFSGTIRQEGKTIDIREVYRLEDGQKTLGGPLGYEFVLDGEVLGAVETVNKGRVILQHDASEELRMIMAATSAALLLRNDLEEAMPE